VERNIARLATAVLTGLLLVALGLGYWQLWEAPALAARPNNPRPYEEDRRVLRGRILDRNGVELARTRPDGTREYPFPGLVHVVGYYSPRFGRTGIEAAYDTYLRGLHSSDPLQRLRDQLLHRPLVGADIRLSIDVELTRLALEALGASAGAAVVLDPTSGEVLALASSPYFDPNRLADQWDALQTDARAPLLARATEGLYTPGSVFKIVTATAAIDLGKVDLRAAHDCTTDLIVDGFRIEQKNHPHLRRVTFAQDFAWSDNVTFAKAGLGLGTSGLIDFDDHAPRPYPWEREGIARSAARLLDYAHRFGFGESIPFDLPVAVSQVGAREGFTPALLASTAFGQGELQVTPLLMALIAATVADGGAMPAPYLAIEARRPDGQVERLHQPGRRLRQVMQPATAAAMNQLMIQSVQEGYARPAQLPGVQVGGKTGTAEVGPGLAPHAWFVGYAPADRPRVVVAVIAENRGSGTEVATPIGRQLLAAALARTAGTPGPAAEVIANGEWPVGMAPGAGALYCPLPARG